MMEMMPGDFSEVGGSGVCALFISHGGGVNPTNCMLTWDIPLLFAFGVGFERAGRGLIYVEVLCMDIYIYNPSCSRNLISGVGQGSCMYSRR